MRTLSAILVLIVSTSAGCMTGGALWYKLNGPSAIPAKYTPAQDATLVMVENYRNPTAAEFDADQLTRLVEDELKKHKIVPLVDQEKLIALRDADPTKFRRMKIQEVGQAVGAKQILYIDLIQSGVDVDPSQNAMHGESAARVRFIDVNSGDNRWPMDAVQGYQVSVNIPYADVEGGKVVAMHNELVTQLSTEISHLFYAWKPESEEQGGNAE